MTDSGKFAQYTPPNTGFEVVFATSDECVEAAVAGRLNASWEPGLAR